MSGVYDMDDLCKAVDALDDRLLEIRGMLIAIAAGVSGLAALYSEDLRDRNPEALARAEEASEKRYNEWEQMIKEGR